MGPCAVAAKALGNTPEEEYKDGLSQIAKVRSTPLIPIITHAMYLFSY